MYLHIACFDDSLEEEKMARNNTGGKIIGLVLTVIVVLAIFLMAKESLQSDLPRVTRFGTEETRTLTSFPAFFTKGEYVCFPTIGKHIFFQIIGGKKEVCQRGEIIFVEEDYQTYIWYR